jgi:hypothetical protein
MRWVDCWVGRKSRMGSQAVSSWLKLTRPFLAMPDPVTLSPDFPILRLSVLVFPDYLITQLPIPGVVDPAVLPGYGNSLPSRQFGRRCPRPFHA